VAEAEVLEPFKDEEKSRALAVGEAAVSGEVFSPAPARFGCGDRFHGRMKAACS